MLAILNHFSSFLQSNAVLLYFLVYKTVFVFQNNLKDLEPSYKIDLGLGDCFGSINYIL